MNLSVWAIKLMLYALVSIGLSWFSFKKIFEPLLVRKIVLFWIFVLPGIFLLQEGFLRFIYFAILLFAFKKELTPIELIVFYIAALPGVPDWHLYPVSLPGISLLTTLDFWKLSVLVLLTPLFFNLSKAQLQLNSLDISVIFFVLIRFVLDMRADGYSPIHGIKFLFENTLQYFVPYFVISRYVLRRTDFDYVALSFFVVTILLSINLSISQIVGFDIYDELNPYRPVVNFAKEWRGSFFRVDGTLSAELMGLIAGMSLLLLLRFNNFFRFGYIKLGVLAVLFFLLILFGGSRGSLISAFLMIGCFGFLYYLKGFAKVFVIAALCAGLLAYFSGFLDGVVFYNDTYGSVSFRTELYNASFEFLKSNLLFGDLYYLYSGFFDHLARNYGGDNIVIDVVSVYLQVALPYGLIGLLSFLSMFILALKGLVGTLISGTASSDQRFYVSFVLSAILGYLFLIGTTSNISLMTQFSIIFLALARSAPNIRE